MTSTMYQSFWEPSDSDSGKSAPTTAVHRDEDGDIVMRFAEDGCDFAVVQTDAQFRAFAAQVAAMAVEMDTPEPAPTGCVGNWATPVQIDAPGGGRS